MVMLEKTLESFLDCQEIKPVNPKGNQPWIFIGRTVAEAEAPAPILYNHLTWRALSLERRLMLGKFEGIRRGWEKMRWLDSITNSMDMNLSKLWEIMDRGDRTEGRGAILGITNSQTWLTDWPMNNPPIEDIFRSGNSPTVKYLDWAVTVSRDLENANIHPWQQVHGHTCFSSLAIETLLCHPMRTFPVFLVLVYECIIWGSIQILTFFIGFHVIHLKLDAETCFFGKLYLSSKVYI